MSKLILLSFLILTACSEETREQIAHDFTYQCINGRVYMVQNQNQWIEPYLDDQGNEVYCAE